MGGSFCGLFEAKDADMICAVWDIHTAVVVTDVDGLHSLIGVGCAGVALRYPIKRKKVDKSVGIPQGKTGYCKFCGADLAICAVATAGAGIQVANVFGPTDLNKESKPVARRKGKLDVPIKLVREFLGFVQEKDGFQFLVQGGFEFEVVGVEVVHLDAVG